MRNRKNDSKNGQFRKTKIHDVPLVERSEVLCFQSNQGLLISYLEGSISLVLWKKITLFSAAT